VIVAPPSRPRLRQGCYTHLEKATEFCSSIVSAFVELPLLVGDMIYFSNYLLKVGSIIVLVLHGHNPYPLHFPSIRLVEREVNYYTLWNGDSWDQYIWQFIFSENHPLLSLGHLLMAPLEVLFIVIVPILTSRDRCFIHLFIYLFIPHTHLQP
jgi:hypothetical protein